MLEVVNTVGIVGMLGILFGIYGGQEALKGYSLAVMFTGLVILAFCL